MEVLARIMQITITSAMYCAVYIILMLFTVSSAIYGYHLLLRLSKLLAMSIILLLLLGLIAYTPSFSLFSSSSVSVGLIWPTWLLSTVSAGLSHS